VSLVERLRPAAREPAPADNAEKDVSEKTAVLALVGLTLLSIVVRMLFVSRVHAPTVFSDEIGYEKLAQSIGKTGHLALFNQSGLSYSPLYPLVLSPIYALGASAPTAYAAIKLVNAVLISLAIVPTYKIARFAVPRGLALIVAGLSLIAPLMFLSSFSMSENLAYPICLVAIWAMLAAVGRPSVWHDAALLAAIALATGTRIQLVVLYPAALTAIVGAALLRPDGGGRSRAMLAELRTHVLFVGAAVAVLVLAGLASLAGHDVLAAFGRYANVGRRGLPNLWHFLNLLIRHVAGLDLAMGVVPFVAALVVTVAFWRSSRRREHVVFAAVAASVSAWLLIEVAFDAALFDSPTGDIPRIHERFLIYAMPFFLTALAVAYRYARSKALERLYVAAAIVAALLPVVIPFDVVINNTISFESIGLEPYGYVSGGSIVALPHTTLVAVWIAATLAFLYVHVRQRLRTVVLLALLPFVAASGLARLRIEATSVFARSLLPAHMDWIDRAVGEAPVVLLTGSNDTTSALQTAYGNYSIDRLYAGCDLAFGSEFGEQFVKVDRSGRILDAAGKPLRVKYAVVPPSFAVQGRVIDFSAGGREILIAPAGGVLRVPAPASPLDCDSATQSE
jgi:hypothetical protein